MRDPFDARSIQRPSANSSWRNFARILWPLQRKQDSRRAILVCLRHLLERRTGLPKIGAASRAVHRYWNDQCAEALPRLTLIETEPVYLSPYQRGGKTKRQTAEGLSVLDFRVEQRGEPTNSLFHIELKSGPGSIDEMKEFQLDINDSNDIVGAAKNTGLPVYIFHVQLQRVYTAATVATIGGGMWWTDIFTLLENKHAERARRGEDKQAGYYSPLAFKPIASFSQALQEGNYTILRERLASEPLEFN